MVNYSTRIKGYAYHQGAAAVNMHQWTNPIIAAAVNLVKEDDFYSNAQVSPENEGIENIQFVVSPPVDIAQFMVFLRELKGVVPGSIVKITGSYQEGCTVIIVLPEPASHASISTMLDDFSTTLGIDVVFKEDW